jgi:ribonuclease HI
MRVTVYVDGLCEPFNREGLATYGLVVYIDGSKVHEGCGVVGSGRGFSNNVAEYSGLVAALVYLLERGLEKEEVTVRTDSMLVANQMSGRWRVKGGLYLSRYIEAEKLARNFPKLRVEWVPREENWEADSLSREAYEDHRAKNGPPARYRRHG